MEHGPTPGPQPAKAAKPRSHFYATLALRELVYNAAGAPSLRARLNNVRRTLGGCRRCSRRCWTDAAPRLTLPRTPLKSSLGVMR